MDTLIISESPINIVKETIVYEIAWGGVTGNIADQTDLNAVLDSFADDLNNLTEELETKASAAAVVQALSTKADLIDGVIPASQLPSYVDDVLVYPNWSAFPVVGETGKIYVTEDTNKTYRWSGSGYVVIADGVALGETATTAYRGDRGKAAYDHSLSQGNPHNATTSDIPEGGKLYFTDSRVRQTVLSGITFTNKAKVTATDSIETAIGKVQSQIDDFSSPAWVNIETFASVVFNSNVRRDRTRIELAKINGMLWIRGYYTRGAGNIVAGAIVFSHNESSYLCDVMTSDSIEIDGLIAASPFVYTATAGANTHTFRQTTQPTNIGLSLWNGSTNITDPSAYVVLNPTPIGKARS